jgi:hypothetical protein
MVDGGLGVHHLVEGIAVLVAVAELEPGARTEHIDVLVVCEPIELTGKRVFADRLQRPSGRVHEHLQRGQALLTVDDAARLEISQDGLLRLNNDRAKEVLGISRRLHQPELSQPPHVLPERRPLLLLLPDVRSLKRRHHEMLRLHEDVLRRPDVGLHQPVLSRPLQRRVVLSAMTEAYWQTLDLLSSAGLPHRGDSNCVHRTGTRSGGRRRRPPLTRSGRPAGVRPGGPVRPRSSRLVTGVQVLAMDEHRS